MSVQVILSKFQLVSNIASIYDKSTPGAEPMQRGHREYYLRLIQHMGQIRELPNLKSESLSFIKKMQELTMRKKVWTYPKLPNVYHSNLNAYKLLQDIIYNPLFDEVKPKNINHRELFNASIDLTLNRTPHSIRNSEINDELNKTKAINKDFIRYQNIASYLEEVRDNYMVEQRQYISDNHHDESPKFVTYSDRKPINIYSFHGVSIVFVRKWHHSKDKLYERYPYNRYILLNKGINRVISFIKDIANIGLMLTFKSLVSKPDRVLNSIVKTILRIAIADPEGVGGIMKAAKQLTFLSANKYNISKYTPEEWYTLSLEDNKLKYAPMLKDLYLSYFTDIREAINFANIFKCVMHPDMEMDEMFNQIDGFKTPNHIGNKEVNRMKAEVTKRVYMSLLRQDYRPKLDRIDKSSFLGSELVRASHKSNIPVNAIKKIDISHWTNVRLLRNERIFNREDVEIKHSNKSSAKHFKINKEIIELHDDLLTQDRLHDATEKIKTVNDMESSLRGTSEINYKEAVARFTKVISDFEEFERNHISENKDAIPSEDVEKWLLEDPDRYYVVLTEPKLFEVHKKNSRIFYMAEQMAKVLQQTAERLTKLIGSKQSGISITKNFRERRRELEDTAHSYTGVAPGFEIEEGIDNDSLVFDIDYTHYWNAFLSFDMQEFSKKFPSAPLRIVGSILADITGEEWMKRIDILFKSSVVIHNTRGYFGFKAGVMGGFEGFFNFIWTLLHSVILDIAISHVGVIGIGVTYSDDGLGRLIYGKKADPYRDTLKIQEVFKSYGLIFNLTKTALSSEIWEYLGEMCIKGVIVDQWTKQYMKFEKVTKVRGFIPFASKINDISSQAMSCIRNGAPHSLISIRMHYMALHMIKRITPLISMSTAKVLLMIPNSAGGFRMRSVYELSYQATIPQISEFVADLELWGKQYPDDVGKIIKIITENICEPLEDEDNIFAGSVLHTYIKDSSGMSIVNKLIDRVSCKFGDYLATNPINSQFNMELNTYLRACKHIDLDSIKSLITHSPPYVEYTNSISMINSSAVLSLIPKDVIKMNQAKDTKFTRECINFWNDKLAGDKRSNGSYDIIEFWKNIMRPYKRFSIKPFRESGRVALYRTDRIESHIIVETSTKRGIAVKDYEYKEPVMSFLEDLFESNYYNESSHSIKSRRLRQFIIHASKIVSTDPTALHLVTKISNILNIPTIRVTSAVSGSAHRIASKNSSNIPVTVRTPKPYFAITNSQITHKLWTMAQYDTRADRTTYTELSKIHHYYACQAHLDRTEHLMDKVNFSYYALRNLEINFYKIDSDYIPHSSDLKIDNTLSKVMLDTLIENDQRLRQSNSIIEENELYGNSQELSEDLIKAYMINKFTKFLWPLTDKFDPQELKEIDLIIPRHHTVDVVLESIVYVTFQKSSKLTRNKIMDLYVKSVRTQDIVSSYTNHGRIDLKLRNKIDKLLSDSSDFNAYLFGIIRAVSNMNISSELNDILTIDFPRTTLFVNILFKTMTRMSLSDTAKLPVTTLHANLKASSTMTSSHKKALKDALDIKIRKLLDVMTNESNQSSIDKSNTDDTIDMLIIAKSIPRSSGHRDSVFNHIMASAELMKMYIMIIHCMNNDIMRLDDKLRSTPITKIMKIHKLAFKGSMYYNRPDVIHALMSPILPELAFRINAILKYIDKDFMLSMKYAAVSEMFDSREGVVDLIQRSLGLTTHVWENVIKEAVKSIVTVNIAYVNELYHAVHQEDKISPVPVINDFPDTFRTTKIGGKPECPKIAMANPDSNADMYLSVLFKHHEDMWNDQNIAYDLGYLKNTEELFDRYDISGSRGKLFFYCRSFDNPKSAISSYLLGNKTPNSVFILVKNNNKFKLIGIGPYIDVDNNDEHDHEYWSDPTKVYHIMHKCIYISIDDLNDKLMENFKYKNMDYRDEVNRFDFIKIATTRSFGISMGGIRQTIDDDPFIVGISDAFRGLYDRDNAYRAYIAILTWFNTPGKIRGSDFMRTHKMVTESVNDRTVLRSLNDDVSLTWNWLQSSGIIAGPNMDIERTAKIASAVLDLPNAFDVHPTATTVHVNTINFINNHLRGVHYANPTELNKYLFLTNLGKLKSEEEMEVDVDSYNDKYDDL